MKFQTMTLCVAAIALAACSGDNAKINAAQEVVSSALKDPESAQFRNVVVLASGTVCGEVNGKNSMGGYTGFTGFYSLEGSDLSDPEKNKWGPVMIVPNDDEYQLVGRVYSNVCGR